MAEEEKQESQKTVVAFITGLLIGGLLVWVFSSTPDNTGEVIDTTDVEEVVNGDDSNVCGTNTAQSGENCDSTPTPENVAEVDEGGGEIVVEDQAAGTEVTLRDVTFPATTGWIVVRDLENDEEGLILGAARFDTAAGLAPMDITLIRPTIAGKTYKLEFYTQEGALTFNAGIDKQLGEASATFKAQ